MDPNAALARLRSLRQHVASKDEIDDFDFAVSALLDMVDLVEGLDDWLSNGGFLPDAWERKS